MNIAQRNLEDAFAALRSSPAGLADSDARGRLREFGSNELARAATTPLLLRFVKSFTHFFATVLWVAALLALVASWQQPGEGMLVLAAAIVGVILINGVFSFWQEYRAERAIDVLQQLLPSVVKVYRDSALLQLAATAIVPGDVIQLQEGDLVPADCRVIDAFDLRVNAATVTGESLPQAKDDRPDNAVDSLHSRNVMLAGTTVVAGNARALVFATGMHTEFGKIAELSQRTDEPLSPLQKQIAHLSRWVAALATLLGIVFFCIGEVMGMSFWSNLMFAIGIIVANVPEGLLPTVTLALALATQRMAARGALVRHLPAVEALGATTVICTDKTGTLTQNHMVVREIWLADDSRCNGIDMSSAWITSNRTLLQTALCNHNLHRVQDNGATRWLGDPMEIALVEFATRALDDAPEPPRIDELAFDTVRKRLTVVCQQIGNPSGFVAYTKGALETVLPLCDRVRFGDADEPMTPALHRQLLQSEQQMASRGLRVLALASRCMDVVEQRDALEQKMIFAGLIGFEDPPRPDVPEAIATCQKAGIRVIMISGDHPLTAQAIAREIGLVQSAQPTVVTGDVLQRMSEAELQLALDAPEILFARVGADQKMRIVEALQRKQEIVAVTGDGVNDAPALKCADIGIAMGSGADAAKQSADMILLDDNFATIVKAVEEGRSVFDNIRKFLTYILTSNIPEIVPYLAFMLFRIPLPLTVIQILAVDLGTDMVPALGLGTEKPDAAVMQRPPRARSERLVNTPLVLRAYLFLGVFEAVAAMAAFFYLLSQGGWRYGELLARHDPLYQQATTACLAAIVVMQVVNVFLCRSDRKPFWEQGFISNRLIVAGIVVEILLLLFIVYSHAGNLLFGTTALPASVWIFVAPFAVLMLLAEEGRKLLARQMREQSRNHPA